MAPPLLSGQGWGHDLIIGYCFMRHYIVTFDYPNRLVTFERPAGKTGPVGGIGLAARGGLNVNLTLDGRMP